MLFVFETAICNLESVKLCDSSTGRTILPDYISGENLIPEFDANGVQISAPLPTTFVACFQLYWFVFSNDGKLIHSSYYGVPLAEAKQNEDGSYTPINIDCLIVDLPYLWTSAVDCCNLFWH